MAVKLEIEIKLREFPAGGALFLSGGRGGILFWHCGNPFWYSSKQGLGSQRAEVSVAH